MRVKYKGTSELQNMNLKRNPYKGVIDSLDPDREYVVYGIAVYNMYQSYLIFLDDHIVYAPISIFNIADDTIPNDWLISVGDSDIKMMPKIMHQDYFLDRHSDYEKGARAKFKVLMAKYKELYES